MPALKKNSPFSSVLRREWQRMTSRRLYFGVCIVLPLFVLVFMSTIFGNGQMEKLPIGVVDQDNTALSRSIIRRISAVPTFDVAQLYVNEPAAREAVQKKEIYGYLSIPRQFEFSVVNGSNATLSYYYHFALLSVGSELMAAFATSLEDVALSPIILQAENLGVASKQITTFLLPVESNDHPIYNPSLDYSIYLSQPFFFVLFQILVMLTTVYIVGMEIKFKTANEWLQTSNGNMPLAVFAKLMPYTVIFALIGCLANYVMFGILKIPFEGSWFAMNMVTVLFVIASQALALFLFSLFPAVSIIISIVSMVGSLGATLSGITFPILNMFVPVRFASYLLPIHYFTEITQSIVYQDASYDYYWKSVVMLCVYPLLAFALIPRLKRAIENHKYENIE
jgi:ABC-type Na+ efflux pump, permease component